MTHILDDVVGQVLGYLLTQRVQNGLDERRADHWHAQLGLVVALLGEQQVGRVRLVGRVALARRYLADLVVYLDLVPSLFRFNCFMYIGKV